MRRGGAGAVAEATGFFMRDDPVHETFGLTGHAWQSLFHLTVGEEVEETRLYSAA